VPKTTKPAYVTDNLLLTPSVMAAAPTLRLERRSSPLTAERTAIVLDRNIQFSES
jgi:hypothetical protein